jgi:hypothetical protein
MVLLGGTVAVTSLVGYLGTMRKVALTTSVDISGPHVSRGRIEVLGLVRHTADGGRTAGRYQPDYSCIANGTEIAVACPGGRLGV